MATYKKQLKDYQGNNILPVIAERELTQAQYNALSDSEKNNGTTYYITDGNPSGSVESYSLTEVPTGGTWIDGKPIYKRTYNCGSLLNNGTRYVNHGITNLGVIMKSEAFAVYEGSVSTGVNLPIPYTAPTGIQNTVTVNFTSTQICLTTGTDRTAATAYVTLWYTKK